jgi:hypothetical protein
MSLANEVQASTYSDKNHGIGTLQQKAKEENGRETHIVATRKQTR